MNFTKLFFIHYSCKSTYLLKMNLVSESGLTSEVNFFLVKQNNNIIIILNYKYFLFL